MVHQGFSVRAIRYSVLIPLIALHIGALAAPFYFSWSAFIWFFILWQVTGTLGITVGYHRLLSHQSFKTYKWITRFHALMGVLSFQQGPLSWVRLHRAHHAYADTDKDPYPQHFGFWFGHMGWPILDVKGIGESGLRMKNPRDLTKDKVLMFLERYNIIIGLASLALIYAVGGLSMFLWAGCARVVWTLHVTLAVNSIGHRWGFQTFKTGDDSKNNFFVALVTAGEGWHNNHHYHPYSARMGLSWWQLDTSWLWIWTLSKLGLAWDVRLPTGAVVVTIDSASNQ